MNTEPIGFKGSKEWRLENIEFKDSQFPTLRFRKPKQDTDFYGYLVLNASHDQERESLIANALLIGAAKKMAVALQNDHDCMLALHCSLLDPTMDRESARQILRDHMEKQLSVLKEAGLNP